MGGLTLFAWRITGQSKGDKKMLGLTEGMKLEDTTVQKIKRYVHESGTRGVSWEEIFSLLEEDMTFVNIEEHAVDIVRQLIVFELLEREEFRDIALC
jgi:N-acetyl-beta-hexosaminidase